MYPSERGRPQSWTEPCRTQRWSAGRSAWLRGPRKSSLRDNRAPGGGPTERIPVCSWRLISALMEKVLAKGGRGRGSPGKPQQACGWKSVSCPRPPRPLLAELAADRPFHVPYVQRCRLLTYSDFCAPSPRGGAYILTQACDRSQTSPATFFAA